VNLSTLLISSSIHTEYIEILPTLLIPCFSNVDVTWIDLRTCKRCRMLSTYLETAWTLRGFGRHIEILLLFELVYT